MTDKDKGKDMDVPHLPPSEVSRRAELDYSIEQYFLASGTREEAIKSVERSARYYQRHPELVIDASKISRGNPDTIVERVRNDGL